MQARSPDCSRQTFGIYRKNKKNKTTLCTLQNNKCSVPVVSRWWDDFSQLLLPHTGTKMSGWKRILSEPRVTVAPTLTLITLGHGRNISDCLVSCERHQAATNPFSRVGSFCMRSKWRSNCVGGSEREVSQVSGGSSAIPVDFEQRFSHHRLLNIYNKGLRQGQKSDQ